MYISQENYSLIGRNVLEEIIKQILVGGASILKFKIKSFQCFKNSNIF